MVGAHILVHLQSSLVPGPLFFVFVWGQRTKMKKAGWEQDYLQSWYTPIPCKVTAKTKASHTLNMSFNLRFNYINVSSPAYNSSSIVIICLVYGLHDQMTIVLMNSSEQS